MECCQTNAHNKGPEINTKHVEPLILHRYRYIERRVRKGRLACCEKSVSDVAQKSVTSYVKGYSLSQGGRGGRGKRNVDGTAGGYSSFIKPKKKRKIIHALALSLNGGDFDFSFIFVRSNNNCTPPCLFIASSSNKFNVSDNFSLSSLSSKIFSLTAFPTGLSVNVDPNQTCIFVLLQQSRCPSHC
jgi:hypothetical protein